MASVSVDGTGIGGTCGGSTANGRTDVTIGGDPINIDGDLMNHDYPVNATNNTSVSIGGDPIIVTGDSVTPHDSKPTHTGLVLDSGVKVTISG